MRGAERRRSAIATPGPRLASLPPPQLAGLVVTVVAGAALRIAFQSGRAFTGDEAGLVLFLPLSYGELLSTFREPWLSMHVYMALTKALSDFGGANAWLMVAPSLVAGLALIPLTAAIALRLASPRVALGAAVLVAANPSLIVYGVQLRSYGLLVALASASFLFFLDWQERGRVRDAWACALAGAGAVLMHAGALLFALFIAAWWLTRVAADGRSWRERWRGTATLWAPLGVAAAVTLLGYAPLLDDLSGYHGRWSGEPPTSLDYAPWVFGRWFGRGAWGLPSLALLATGLFVGIRLRRPVAGLALSLLVPMAALSFLGVLHFPWGYARYLVPALPLLLILLCSGADAAFGRRAPWIHALCIGVVLLGWIPGLGENFEEKRRYPWLAVARFLEDELGPGDALITTDERQLHPETALTALLGSGRAPFRSLATFVETTSPGRLVVVNPHEPIVPGDPERLMGRFGDVEILVYGGVDRRRSVAQLAGDLRRSTDGRVAAGLAGQYRLIRNAERLLDDAPPDPRWTALYYESASRTERIRRMPDGLLEQRGRPGAAAVTGSSPDASR